MRATEPSRTSVTGGAASALTHGGTRHAEPSHCAVADLWSVAQVEKERSNEVPDEERLRLADLNELLC